MGLRFRRRVHIAPGVDLNLSNKSASVSVGPRGARFTAGPRGTRATVGIPGTGLSYTQTQSAKPQKRIGLVKALLSAMVMAAVMAAIGVPPEVAAWIAIVIAGLAWIGGFLPSKAMIFGAAIGTAAMIAANADAQVTSRHKCARNTQGGYSCRYEVETPRSVTNTYCDRVRGQTDCETETVRKGPPPQPTIEHSDTGVVIMRGGPR